jgi:hypothetical protein
LTGFVDQAEGKEICCFGSFVLDDAMLFWYFLLSSILVGQFRFPAICSWWQFAQQILFKY